MNLKELIKVPRESSFIDIIHKMREQLSRNEFGDLNMHHRDFMNTFSYLPIIWERIINEAQTYEKYWEIYVDLYAPGSEERKPTDEEKKILDEHHSNQLRLHLDYEDWFIHSSILLDKYVKFIVQLQKSISLDKMERHKLNQQKHRSFHQHKDLYCGTKNRSLITDKQYEKLIRNHTLWFEEELKNVRDDWIQHELVPKFWGYDIKPSKKIIRLMRFRHDEKLFHELLALREKYAQQHKEIAKEENFFELLFWFEKQKDVLDKDDVTRVERVRRRFGGDFPDIPTLFNKMTQFFELVNNHFLSEISKRFGKNMRKNKFIKELKKQ